MAKHPGHQRPRTDDGIPRCCMCLNHQEDVYATMAFRTFEESEAESSYCDVCGPAMASVIRDGQHREPVIRKLTPPKAPAKAPPKSTPAPLPPKPAPALQAPPEPPRRGRLMDAAREAAQEDGGHDLLSLLGWKK